VFCERPDTRRHYMSTRARRIIVTTLIALGVLGGTAAAASAQVPQTHFYGAPAATHFYG
jgi:hypothetical protein